MTGRHHRSVPPGHRARRLVSAVIGSLLLVTAGCQVAETLPVPSDRSRPESAMLDHRHEITVERISYTSADGTSDPEQNWGELHLPAGVQRRGAFPLIILVHGGGWRADNGARALNRYARMLVEYRIAVFNIEYRRVGSGGGFPMTFADVAGAFNTVPRLLKRHPQLSEKQVIAVGHSAGGQLAVWAATSAHRSPAMPSPIWQYRPQAVVSLAGTMAMATTVQRGNRNARAVMGGPPSQVPANYEAVDPIKNQHLPVPVIAVHGSADQVVDPDFSRDYIAAARLRNQRSRLVSIPGATHLSIITPARTGYDVAAEAVRSTARHPNAEAGDGPS